MRWRHVHDGVEGKVDDWRSPASSAANSMETRRVVDDLVGAG